MSGKSFTELEREGWQRNAADYDDFVLPLTDPAIAPLLDSLGPLTGRKVLELASGSGHLAAAAVARGATMVGIDTASNMVELARRNAPAGTEFLVGDAEALDFEDSSFDAVTCSFGFLHFAQPERVLHQVVRVLKPGGRLSFTVWQAPDKGNEFLGLVLGTVQKHANLDVDLPPAPPMFALADPDTAKSMLSECGFVDVGVQDLPIEVSVDSGPTPLEFLLNGAVRGRMLYDLQTPDVQAKIRDALEAATAPYAGKKSIACTAVIITARKPD